LSILTSRYDARDASAKSRICAEMLPTIAKVTNAVLKFEYIKRLAERLQVREEALLTELKKVKPDYTYEPSDETTAPAGICSGTAAEKAVIGLMLEDAEFIAEVLKHLKAEDFSDEKTRKIAAEIFKAYAEGKALNAAQFINRFDDDDLNRIVSESSGLTEIMTDRQKNLSDCIKNMKDQNNRNKLTELRNLINVAQMMGDGKKVDQLLAELSNLLRGSKEFARR
jgi:DNA primase